METPVETLSEPRYTKMWVGLTINLVQYIAVMMYATIRLGMMQESEETQKNAMKFGGTE